MFAIAITIAVFGGVFVLELLVARSDRKRVEAGQHPLEQTRDAVTQYHLGEHATYARTNN